MDKLIEPKKVQLWIDDKLIMKNMDGWMDGMHVMQTDWIGFWVDG